MANKVKGADLNVPAEKLKSIEAGALRRGAAKYADVDGPADFPKKDTKQHMASVKHAKDGMHLGAKRMGYSQSFGASRMNSYARGAAKVMDIMNFGAANAGHGGVAGHSHPSMTTKERKTSGGGSSSTSTTNYDAVVKSEGTKIVDPSKITPAMTAAANAKRKAAKLKDKTASTTPATTTTSSTTVVSPKSLKEVEEKGKITNENRVQKNKFKKDLTNILAVKDSTNAANKYLDKLPAHLQSRTKAKKLAGKKGGRVAQEVRKKSGDFSSVEAYKIYLAGQNK